MHSLLFGHRHLLVRTVVFLLPVAGACTFDAAPPAIATGPSKTGVVEISPATTGGTPGTGGAAPLAGTGGGAAGPDGFGGTGDTEVRGEAVLLEAEDYAASLDSTPGNSGHAYRNEDVDIESCSEGGFNVAWVQSGEWLEYPFEIGSTDIFDLSVRVASPLGNAQGLQIQLDGVTVSPWTAVPDTASWQTWQDVRFAGLSLAAGSHTLRLLLGGDFNLNSLYLASATHPPPRPAGVEALPPPEQPADYVRPVDRHGQLQVIGTSLSDQSGNPVQLVGMSTHGLQYHPPVEGHTIPNLAYGWRIEVIRPAMYVEDVKKGEFVGGYLAQPEYMKRKLEGAIADALSTGLYVIVDWHLHNDPTNFTVQALEFFRDMASRYGTHPNILYEICNEPEYTSWDTIKTYANAIIPEIRSLDPDNVILVGTPTWSQDVDVAADDPLVGYTNIMYALHFYTGAHGQSLRDKAEYALERGLPLFVSEWGTSDHSGGSNGAVYLEPARVWLDWMNARNLSFINWSFSNKAESSAALLPGVSMAGPWGSDDLSVSGSFVKAEIAARIGG